MIATHLKAPAFCGRNLNHEFTAANLIVGNPFSGKTAITQALRLSMYGIIASLGKEHKATFKPCSDEKELFSRLTFDNGKTNTVTVNRDSEGRFTGGKDLQVEFPDVMMDINEYFKLTGQKQLDYVLRRVDMKRVGYDESALMKDMVMAISDETKSAYGKWQKTFHQSIDQRDRQKQGVSAWMETLVAQFKTGEKDAKETIKTQKAVVEAFKAQDEPKDVSKERAAAQDALQKAQVAAVVPKDTKKREAESSVVNAERSVQDLEGDIDDIDHEIASMKKLTHCPTCLSDGKDWLKAWLKNKNEDRKQVNTKLVDARKVLEESKKQLAALEKKSDAAQAKKLVQAVENAQAKFDELDEQHIQWNAYQQNKEAVAKAKEKITQAEAERVVIDHMKSQLETHQQALAEKAFAHLLKIARKFTDGILNSPLEYRDGDFGRKVSELDRRSGMDAPLGHWIPHETFSGTERLLAYSGLQVALCQNSPAKIVVFDEMQRTGDKRQAIARRLLELEQEKILDQFFLVDNSTEPYAPVDRQMNVIRL